MTTINCCQNCVYQTDGKCCYDDVVPGAPVGCTQGQKCAYLVENTPENRKKYPRKEEFW